MSSSLYERLRDLIDGLEALDTDEIVRFFESEGIKGEPTDACHCPVSNYITREVNPFYVSTTWGMTHIFEDIDSLENQSDIRIEFPEDSSLSTFIQKFDNGDYPQLVVDCDS